MGQTLLRILVVTAVLLVVVLLLGNLVTGELSEMTGMTVLPALAVDENGVTILGQVGAIDVNLLSNAISWAKDAIQITLDKVQYTADAIITRLF